MMNYYNSLRARPGTDLRKTWRTTLALIAFFAMFGVHSVMGQVNVTATTGSATYASLSSVITNVNSGCITGAISITITADLTENTQMSLNASGVGSASYTSILISPSGARTISGAPVAGTALLLLNGADNVTIDGLNTGGNSLTWSNTTVSSTANTSTIRFVGDATSNTITNCSILGSSTTTSSTDGANIVFSTGVTTGNDNNTISNNNIGPAGTNLPSRLIYSNGTTTTTTTYNSGITITGNNLYDFFLATGGDSHGIYAQTGTTAWTISNNKIYQTASRTFTAGSIRMYGINFNNSNADNVQITGNTIGYASSTGTGTLTILGSGVSGGFTGIYFLASSTAATTCNVNNNTISDISFTSSSGVFTLFKMGRAQAQTRKTIMVISLKISRC